MGTDLRDLLPEGVDPPPAGATMAAVSQGPQQWAGKSNTSEPPPAVAYYTGAMDHESPLVVEAWLQSSRFLGIWALTDSCFYEFSHANRSTVIVAFDPANVTQEQEDKLRRTAHAFRDSFFFGVLDGVSWAQELHDFNIMTEDLPRVLVTEDNFESWIEDVEKL